MTALFKLFDLLPGWCWALACAALLLVAGVERERGQHDRMKLAQAQAQIATERAQAAVAARNAEAAARTEESRRETATRKVIEDARTEAQTARDDAAAAARAADSLRQRVAALVAASRRAAQNPAARSGGEGQPGADAIDVLADVFQWADGAAGELAAYADQLRTAGLACERQHDALTAPAAGVSLFPR